MQYFSLNVLLTALSSLIFSFVVFYKNRTIKREENKFWALVCLCVFLWLIGLYLEINSTNEKAALFWNKILYIGAIFVPMFYFHFIILFLGKKRKWMLFLGYSLAIFFIFINVFSNLFVRGVPPMFNFNFWVEPGPFYYFYFVYFIIFFAFSFLYLFKYGFIHGINSIIKQQSLYFLISGIFGFSGGITAFFPQFFGVYPVGVYFVILYEIIVIYAILKHRLMGIRFIASRIYIYVILTASVFLFLQLNYWLNNFSFIEYLGEQTIGIDLLLSLVFVVFFVRLVGFLQKSSDILFYRGHDPQRIIKELSLRLREFINISDLTKILEKEFKKILATEKVYIIFGVKHISANVFAKNRKELVFSLFKTSQKKPEKMVISANNPLYLKLTREGKTIVRDEIEKDGKEMKVVKEMKKRRIALASSLKVRGKIIGAILLGEKIDQSAYSQEDIEFLDIISSQIAVAIENASLYEETKQFNIKLKRKIKEATKDLREVNKKLLLANQKLRVLDQAKSEFISIASHQLRTPLTSIKGFISLLLEGSYGKISKKIQIVLEKIYISNERLINLVEDLLNISRIESDKISFNFVLNDIEKTIRETLETFKIMAKSRNIELSFQNQTHQKIPPFYFDKPKIQEVISNLVDNSFKYTNQGFIKVFLRDMGKTIQVEVRDTGIGIDPRELPTLFQKFMRGKETSKLYTEGTGLGLFVCKKIIEAHRGKIWAESKGKNKGSRFIFELRKDLKKL